MTQCVKTGLKKVKNSYMLKDSLAIGENSPNNLYSSFCFLLFLLSYSTLKTKSIIIQKIVHFRFFLKKIIRISNKFIIRIHKYHVLFLTKAETIFFLVLVDNMCKASSDLNNDHFRYIKITAKNPTNPTPQTHKFQILVPTHIFQILSLPYTDSGYITPSPTSNLSSTS